MQFCRGFAMGGLTISPNIKNKLLRFLDTSSKNDILGLYLCYVGHAFKVSPVLCVPQKKIYKDSQAAVKAMEAKKSLWRETEVLIRFGEKSVNDETKKVYICPFTGKVFGDNTHPNPHDAIYDWVSNCAENTERDAGLPVKRFFVSEDAEIIKSYQKKSRAVLKKTVFSSLVSGKLFNSRESVIDDFKKCYLKPMTLFEVQSQNRFEIDEALLHFIQKHLTEEKVSHFIEHIASYPEFAKYAKLWM